MSVAAPREQLRKDAKRNRAAILEAARELFAESADVSMCEIARRAGVGHATVYRNFPDKIALAAEVLGEHIERFAVTAAEHEDDPDAFFVLLRTIVEDLVHLYALSVLAREDATVGSQLEHNRARIAELMKKPLRDAKAAGTLRRDATIDDVFLVIMMAKGAMEKTSGPAARAAAAGRVLTLALDGLVTVGARG